MLNDELSRKSSEFRGALLRRETVRFGNITAGRSTQGDGFDVRGSNWASCNMQLSDAVSMLMRLLKRDDDQRPVDLATRDQ